MPQERVDSVLWYPPVNTAWWAGGSGAVSYPQLRFTEGKDLFPEENVVLKEGSKVISTDGKTIGTVAQVIMDRPTRTATHIVISAGLFLKEEKVIPTLWIKEVKDDVVKLSVWSDMFDSLPRYEPAKSV
ncbi:MAG: PRC-barrel domain-containing protein [Anaerolineales bacterium]